MATWAQWFKLDNFTVPVFSSKVKLSNLNHDVHVVLLNSDVLTINDDFCLKPKRNSQMAQVDDTGK